MTRVRPLLSTLLVLAVAGPAVAVDSRTPLSKRPIAAPALRASSVNPAPLGGLELVVKFADRAKVRSTASGGLISLTDVDLSGVLAVAGARDLVFSPLFRLDEGVLAGIEERAVRRSGRAQPDLAGMLRVTFVGKAIEDRLVAAGEALQALDVVEFASIHALLPPPPTDLPPDTPDMTPLQGYHGPDPGIDATFAWSYPGGTGAGVRISDCEYGWDPDHEDLNDIDLHLEAGQTIHPEVFDYEFDYHGTAVLGQTSSQDNGYGCTGLVPDAEVGTFPEYTVEGGVRRVDAIAAAIAASDPGDVVLLEMQDLGAGGDYGPAEVWEPVWVVTRTGVDAGVVIVAAAGNGDQDLDAQVYVPYMNQGDSGAIIVGAGTADLAHDKMYFSTYGSRVNVHAWGESVRTLAYGDGGMIGGPQDVHQYYTAEFAGTSSASPIVAAACVALQGIALQQTGATLEPAVLRELLIQTGVPQGTGGHIGPLPDLAAAIALQFDCTCADADGDGYLTCDEADCPGVDCDDADAEIHPDADEDCGDGEDNDCDGLVDGQDDECAGDDDTTSGDDDSTADDDTAGDDDSVDDDTPDDDADDDDDGAVYLTGNGDCSCALASATLPRPSASLGLLVVLCAYRVIRRSSWPE